MSKIKTVFLSSKLELNEFGSDVELECYATVNNEIYLCIKGNYEDSTLGEWITIDKETAIKLSKVLKTEISKINE